MSRAKRTCAGLLLASLLGLSACGDARGTSLRLRITADPEVQARASAVRLEVVAGHAPATRTVDETLALEGRGWPLTAIVQPLDGDATRPLQVTLEALDARSRVVARVRAAPAFVPGTVRDVELRFEAAPHVTQVPDAGTPRDASVAPSDAGSTCEEGVDEGCECRLGTTRECEGGRDVCVRGVQTCLGQRWSDCAGRIEARSEECNTLDDDCDGRVDEDLRRRCGRRCHSRCALGVWGPCVDRDEACDEEPDDD